MKKKMKIHLAIPLAIRSDHHQLLVAPLFLVHNPPGTAQ